LGTQQNARGREIVEYAVATGFSHGGRSAFYNTVVHSQTESEYEMAAAMTSDKFQYIGLGEFRDGAGDSGGFRAEGRHATPLTLFR